MRGRAIRASLLVSVALAACHRASSGSGTQACTPHVASPSGPTAEPAGANTNQTWVIVDADSNPQSVADSDGNRIPDFSFAGYGGGGVALPTVAAATGATPLRPSGGDDTPMIQAAIDALAQRPPDANGFRGAVVLASGTFTLAGQLHIGASGVVLRGQGEDPTNGTTLSATGSARTVIAVGVVAHPRALGSANVTDDYVPVGATQLRVDVPSLFAPGTAVMVQRPQTAAWICELGMDSIPPRSDGKAIMQWSPGAGLEFARTVASVSGNLITLDVPLTNALEHALAPATVWPYSFAERIDHVGVEQLRGLAAFSDGATSYLASLFVDVEAVSDGWLSHVTADGFGNGCVLVGAPAARITVADSTVVHPLIPPSIVADPAGFTIAGQETLVVRGHVEGEGLHALMSESNAAGPNVALDLAVVGSDVDVSAHQRWAAGLLLDRTSITAADGRPSGTIAVQNRGNLGTGQGWAGANWVVWNATAARAYVDTPPTARNWVIGGALGQIFGTGDYSFVGTTVTPASLYLAQLRARLGDAAVHAIGY